MMIPGSPSASGRWFSARRRTGHPEGTALTEAIQRWIRRSMSSSRPSASCSGKASRQSCSICSSVALARPSAAFPAIRNASLPKLRGSCRMLSSVHATPVESVHHPPISRDVLAPKRPFEQESGAQIVSWPIKMREVPVDGLPQRHGPPMDHRKGGERRRKDNVTEDRLFVTPLASIREGMCHRKAASPLERLKFAKLARLFPSRARDRSVRLRQRRKKYPCSRPGPSIHSSRN